MHLVHAGSSPSYLPGLVTATASMSFRKRLRSADTNHYEPLTTRLKFGERCFTHVGHKAWNELPTELQDLTDHRAFGRKLNTLNVRLLHSDSLAADHSGVGNGQSESESESRSFCVCH